jgi:ABC-type sulfate transport system substrate-binding protein
MPPLFCINSITLPTKTAKAKVLSIHPSLKRETKRLKVELSAEIIEKSWRKKSPKNIPPNKESIIFLVYKAKAIAKRDGKIERSESSITKP